MKHLYKPVAVILLICLLISFFSGCGAFHRHEFNEKVIYADCEHAGYTVYSCACGEGYQDSVVPALGHEITVSVIQDATCTDNGLKRKSCSRCELTEEEVIPTVGHEYLPWVELDEPGCDWAGKEEHTCGVCDFVETRCIEALGHDLSDWIKVSELSCETDAYSYRECSRCDYKEEQRTETRGHNWSAWKTTKEPTCSSHGQKERYCTVTSCGKKETESIAKTSHNYKDGYCTRCGAEDTNHYPKVYEDSGVKITIYKQTWGSKDTVCYVADVQLQDYSRFFTACGKNKYGGQSTTSAAAKLQDAVFAINGCYSAPYLDYTVVRRGVIHNGGSRNCNSPAFYSSVTGLFGDNKMLGVNGVKVSDAVAQGLITDTFCFGPAILQNGEVTVGNDSSRAQRTFIGTDGNPGHMIICVSNGRYSDGKSAGLTYREMATLLQEYGCTFGIPLDGGGSSTMVFKGKILNQLADGQERGYIVDFACIGNP